MNRKMILLLGAAAFVHGAFAADPAGYFAPDDQAPYGATQEQVRSSMDNCERDQTTLNICAWADYRDSLKSLHSAEAAVRRAMIEDKTRRAFFDKAQKYWVANRNADCDLDASGADGGSMIWMLVYNCRTKITNTRTTLLNSFAFCLAHADDNKCGGQPVGLFPDDAQAQSVASPDATTEGPAVVPAPH